MKNKLTTTNEWMKWMGMEGARAGAAAAADTMTASKQRAKSLHVCCAARQTWVERKHWNVKKRLKEETQRGAPLHPCCWLGSAHSSAKSVVFGSFTMTTTTTFSAPLPRRRRCCGFIIVVYAATQRSRSSTSANANFSRMGFAYLRARSSSSNNSRRHTTLQWESDEWTFFPQSLLKWLGLSCVDVYIVYRLNKVFIFLTLRVICDSLTLSGWWWVRLMVVTAAAVWH